MMPLRLFSWTPRSAWNLYENLYNQGIRNFAEITFLQFSPTQAQDGQVDVCSAAYTGQSMCVDEMRSLCSVRYVILMMLLLLLLLLLLVLLLLPLLLPLPSLLSSW